jgi:uridylate kinase
MWQRCRIPKRFEGARQMKRVLLKLSGEALAGDKKTGFDEATCIGVANQVKQLVDQGIQVAIVTAEISGEAVPVRRSTVQRLTRSECLQR